ncbi:dihydrolipoamide acetyltransferase family protein [Brochothrix thermosphacta]|uniref:dihydrolipoamide acetyltransferase family protein n=1 Tax=Brochothrix thermosphacta TaxID=2756 RepID=UPI000ED01445|nr:dihydrolipoamide acetyltransferase family protein [Brochothrix thermosphacta]HCZ39593.1 branched-chain alpha-keto acid dehydrogenase subunit E2 [Brochothrix thermosphacta]HCZ45843.1 branched-chain alpha-keto acid dehydrogenase subunit E2 [Brochothrix thermosphacta]
MAIENIKMPQLGESVTEGTITAWLVQPGDHVEQYDPIAEVLTDKVTAEIPSSFTGTIKEILVEADVTVPVGEVICTMETAGEATTPDPEAETEKVAPTPEPVVEAKAAPAAPVAAPVAATGDRARYSPVVLRLSQEKGIDLTQVTGTGKGGRITRKDVLGFTPSAAPAPEQTSVVSETPAPSVAPTASASTPIPTPTVAAGDVTVPVTPIRKAIAKHMVQSSLEIPHAWVMVEVDATELVNYRNSIKDEFKAKEGFSISYFAFFVKAVAQALKKYPELNSTWTGESIIQRHDINLSIAVATDDALFVPVVRNADEKTVKGIGKEIADLAGKVRTGKLTSKEMDGGTFTVNSTGSFGSVQSMGIINHPQAAILQVESIVKRPVVKDGMIAVRDMVNLCLSIDHRVLDGLVAGRFLQEVKNNVEAINSKSTSVY